MSVQDITCRYVRDRTYFSAVARVGKMIGHLETCQTSEATECQVGSYGCFARIRSLVRAY